MFTTTFSGELINVALRQLGATHISETRNGIMYKVEFKLSDELTVTYVFDVTKHDKYYIQRIVKSHNFPKFLDTANSMVMFTHAIELLFLERNIPESDMDTLRQSIEDSLDKVREIYARTPKIEKE